MISFRTGAVALCAIALISFASCGGSSSSTDDTTTGTASGMSGQLTAADGSPLSGAFVGVSETSSASLIKAATIGSHGHPIRYTTAADDEGDECEDVSGEIEAAAGVDFLTTDCTDSSGNYNITLEITCDTPLTLTIVQGSFRMSLGITASCDGVADSDGDGETDDEVLEIDDIAFDDDCTLDDEDSEEDPTDVSSLVAGHPAYTTSDCDFDLPAMAVTIGYYDAMQHLLAKFGFGEIDEFGELDESLPYDFDLYDNGDSDADGNSMTTELLLSDIDLLSSYDIVFINCGNADETLFATHSDNLSTYVDNGGILYVTDWSYQAIEQPYSDLIEFVGDDTSPTAAKVGMGFITSDATVDEDLGEWLDNVTVNPGNPTDDCGSIDATTVNSQFGARNTDGTVPIADFLGSWVVMEDIADDGVLWASGPIESSFGSDLDAPLTVSRPQGDGAIAYSSYHTAHSCPTTGFWPQERILQYLVFE